jgi:hypothetical protein
MYIASFRNLSFFPQGYNAIDENENGIIIVESIFVVYMCQ